MEYLCPYVYKYTIMIYYVNVWYHVLILHTVQFKDLAKIKHMLIKVFQSRTTEYFIYGHRRGHFGLKCYSRPETCPFVCEDKQPSQITKMI